MPQRASCGARLHRWAGALPPTTIFALLVAINIINYVDRGVIPGGYDAIEALVRGDASVPGGATNTDTWYGALTSAFVVGYSVAAVALGHAAQVVRPGTLVTCGLAVWVAAVAASAASPSFWLLLASRCLSGVGEAAFQLVVPPWVEDAAPAGYRGLWLSILFSAIPVGTALGYVLGGAGAASWRLTFAAEAVLVAPLLPLVYALPLATKATPPEVVAAAEEEDDGDDDGAGDGAGDGAVAAHPPHHTPPPPPPPPPLRAQFGATLGDPVYTATVLGYAGLTAVLAGLGAFGPAFLQGLGFVRCQATASLLFGACVSVAGLVGTPLGGWALDAVVARDLARARGSSGGGSAAAPAAAVKPDARGDGADADAAAVEAPLLPPPPVSPTGAGDSDDAERAMDDSSYLTLSPHGRWLKLQVCLWQSAALAVVGFAVVALSVPAAKAGLGVGGFMAAITLGATALFAASSPVNLGIMAVAPPSLRPFSIGLSTLLVHALGDTPSPTIIGALADRWSPEDCSGSSGGGGDCPSPCPRSQSGLLASLGAVICWLAWPVLLWGSAYVMARRRGPR
jgi:MFS family permease